MVRAPDVTPAGAGPPPVRVRGNDWRAVAAPALADFARVEPVSVVVPCFEAPAALELALAALERQTWPRERFEVVVVDDGSEPPVVAPATPLDVRIVRQERRGFGLARARNAGARAARHDILVFLDGDLLAAEDVLAEHARWHHAAADALSLGFTAYAATDGLAAAAVRGHAGPLAALLSGRPADPPWTERHMARTDGLTATRDDLFRAVVGNNLGMRRAFFEELGGFDESFRRYGWEDTEFGWRAQTRGALLVPARAAFAWHQGRYAANRTPAKRSAVAAQARRGGALIAHPHFRAGPAAGGAAVPQTAVTVRPAGPGAAATVARLLAGDDADLVVCVDTGAGAEPDEREALAARHGADRRVVLAPGCDAAAAFPATPWHVEVPADAAVGPALLRRLRSGVGTAAVGIASLPDGRSARIVRAWALHRAGRAGGRPEDYGEVRSFALGGAGDLAWTVVRALRLLPALRRPLAGPARVAAEAARLRGTGDLRLFVRWLAAGLAWRVSTRRRLRGPPRLAVRPRQLLRLALRRAFAGGPGGLAAATALAAGTLRRRSPYETVALGIARCGRAGGVRRGCAAAAHAAGDGVRLLRFAATAARTADRRAEKIVSERYRFVWIANPKAASRSLLRALAAADPDARLIREATLAEVYAGFPEARGYFSFAFVRDPVGRAVSCYADKIAGQGNVDVDAFAGLELGMGLDAFCAWLESPWGSDAFADRHWLSQAALLREAPGGRLPDFVGRFERLAEDLGTVAAGLGMPCPPLGHFNRGAGAAPVPSKRALAALERRYAGDFATFGYVPPSRRGRTRDAPAGSAVGGGRRGAGD